MSATLLWGLPLAQGPEPARVAAPAGFFCLSVPSKCPNQFPGQLAEWFSWVKCWEFPSITDHPSVFGPKTAWEMEIPMAQPGEFCRSVDS